MRRVLSITFSILFVLTLFGQNENKPMVLVEGHVMDAKLMPVAYANILIKSRHAGTIGDYQGNYKIVAFPGDTMIFSSVSYRKTSMIVPGNLQSTAYKLDIILESDTIGLKEVVIYPWPSTFEQFKEEFMEVEVEDPLAGLDLHLPSPDELKILSQKIGEPGQINLYSGPGPFSLLYDKFSKEAKSKRLYSEVLKKEKAEIRYNRAVVSRITGLKNEEEVMAFMRFCPLDVSFIFRSSDYDLYLAIWNCYVEYAYGDTPPDSIPD